jgi:hypothetical protein
MRWSAGLVGLVALFAVSAFPGASSAQAAESVRYGIEDDAWLLHGPGTLTSRINELERLHVDIVRFTLHWNEIARTRPASGGDPTDPAYRWRSADTVLTGLRRQGIAVVLTLVGTPGWANGGRTANWAPDSSSTFANFASAAAKRYSWVQDWTIWNEPNLPAWLRPTDAGVYVNRLLNPGYVAIHGAIPDALVGGGMTSPRGGTGGVSPVAWIRAMGKAKARLDAYAHHPYPSRPKVESPWGPACTHCSTITMAELGRLLTEVQRAFGPKRIWLTEYGYQTNPPDLLLGVPLATQAQYVASAARRVYLAQRVDMLVYYLVQDDADPDGWQSGLLTAEGLPKPSYTAFRLPFTEVGRNGDHVNVWGQIRAGSGRRPFRLRAFVDGRWAWLGGTRLTDARGFFTSDVRAPRGSHLQVWSPRDRAYGLELRV